MSAFIEQLHPLMTELGRQERAKRDYVADTREIKFQFDPATEAFSISVPEGGEYRVNDTAHRQVSEFTGIPQRYYQRMREETPGLLVHNVGVWLERSEKRRMVRTLDGMARAFLSDRYYRIDHAQIALVAQTELARVPGAVVRRFAMTERRLYLKVSVDRMRREVRRGDIVEAGVIISNSETGEGTVKVDPFLYQLKCLNGWRVDVSGEAGFIKRHVGAVINEGEVYSRETVDAAARVINLQVRDTIRRAIDEGVFSANVDRMVAATERTIAPAARRTAVEILAQRMFLSTVEREDVETHLFGSEDFTAYGLGCAITRAAQDVGDADRQVELETIGAKVLTLPANDWRAIAEAA